MPKIIFSSRYLRDASPEQLENYVRYIGTREGVEKMDESKRHLPATTHQKEFNLPSFSLLQKERLQSKKDCRAVFF